MCQDSHSHLKRHRAGRQTSVRGAILIAVLLSAGCATPGAVDQFGPPTPAAQPEHAIPVMAATERVAPGYLPSRSVPMPKAVRLQQTRIDALDPHVQNWEVELDLLRSGANSADEDELFAAWMTGRPGEGGLTTTRVEFARSDDGGRSFTPVQVQSPISQTAIPFDPTVEFDPISRRTYVSIMEQEPAFLRKAWVARSEPGDSLRFARGVLVPRVENEATDKGWLAIGPAAGASGRSAIYLASLNGLRVSRDEGATWQGPTRLPNAMNLLQPIVLEDGTLGVSYLGTAGQALFTRSADGLEFTPPVAIHTFVGGISELTHPAIPGSFRAPTTTMVARAPAGRLYAVLHDITRREGAEADLDLLMFRSDDGGRTWSSGRNLSSDLPAFSDQFLPWLAVDAQGRLHLAYFDTARHAGVDADVDAKVDVWYATSSDEGVSWSRTRLTEAPIDSFGTRWSPLGNANTAQFLGDYFTLVASRHAVYVAHPVHVAGVYGMTVSRIDLSDGPAPIRDLRGLSGLWYEPATSGQGFEFNWLAGDKLALTFYGHRDNGANLFLTGVRSGRFGYGETLEIPLHAVSGGRFNGLDPAAIRSTPWGRLVLRFDSCGRAEARLEGADGNQVMQLVRLALAPDLPCD